MLRTAALTLLLSIASPALAQAPPPCTTSAPAQFVTRLADLPEDIRKSVFRDGPVADPGHSFPFSALVEPHRPQPVQRMALAGRSGDKWFVWIERDEMGFLEPRPAPFPTFYHVLGFELSGSRWYRSADFYDEPCAATNAFLAGVRTAAEIRPRAPLTYRDPASNTLFYVESDGRHVTALAPDGTILWKAEPFADGKLDLYRTEHPFITYIGTPPTWLTNLKPGEFISITYNSSQFGLLSIKDGSFRWLGQD